MTAFELMHTSELPLGSHCSFGSASRPLLCVRVDLKTDTHIDLNSLFL